MERGLDMCKGVHMVMGRGKKGVWIGIWRRLGVWRRKGGVEDAYDDDAGGGDEGGGDRDCDGYYDDDDDSENDGDGDAEWDE